jgi:protein subunit release factor B
MAVVRNVARDVCRARCTAAGASRDGYYFSAGRNAALFRQVRIVEKEKTLLFSLTKNDFEFQTFCTGGKGGQHRNAKQNGVRCIHTASGARGEHRDGRDQFLNRREAFTKCCESAIFQIWHKAEVARRLGQLSEIEKSVEEQMRPENLRIEYGVV